MAALRRSAAEQQLAAVPARDDGALPSELEALQVAFQKPRIEVNQNATDQAEANDDVEEDGVKELREKDVVDQRALLHLKLEPIPPDAASFRTWKNGFKVQLSKLDTSGQGIVLAWISRGFDADRVDLEDSGLLPRLDAWVAGELSSGRVLKQSSELEQDITAYIERCSQLDRSPKGRVMLSIIARHYDLDRVRGSVLTASTLFQIELGGNSIKDLRDFVNRIRIVLSAIPVGQRPDDRLTGEWLFHRVKHIRKLERVIEDIRDSASTSHRREWAYLWDKIQDLIVQDREDSNAQSVLKSLQAATPQAKTKAVPAVPPPSQLKVVILVQRKPCLTKGYLVRSPLLEVTRESLSLLDFFGWVEFLDLGLLLISFLWLRMVRLLMRHLTPVRLLLRLLVSVTMNILLRLFHFPKNPFCDVCNQARMLSRRVRRKPRDHDEEPDPLEASEFGEVIAADHIHVFRSPDDSDALDKTYVVLCLRDKYTGLFAAYPGTDRSTASIVSSLRKFVGRRICSKPVTLVSDAADEFVAAAEEMGWISSPSLPNRFPHNAQLEREIRTFQEGVRASFLEAGFSIRPELWPIACRYGSMALNLTLPSPADESCNRWVFMNDDAGRDEVPVKKLLLGQLVFYRNKSDSKFGPNAAPGLFAGWRLEPGCIYRSVTYVLDLEKLRLKSGAWTDPLSVPEAELYVRSGDPVFPLRNAAEHALLSFAELGDVEIPEPLPLPFTPHVFGDKDGRKKIRRIYITYARFRKIGPTPGCSACDNDKSNHTPECIARFEKAFGRESKAPETPVPKEFLSYEELTLPRPVVRPDGDHLSDIEPSGDEGEQVNLTDPVTVDQLVWKSQRTLLGFLQVAAAVLSNDGEVVVDWPQDSSSWMLPEVQAFEDQFGFKKVTFKGCALGMVSSKGDPFDAPWQIMSSSKRIIDNFKPFKCKHAPGVKHDKASALWPRVAHYPRAFHEVLLMSLFPFAKAFQSPALPCVPCVPQIHREKDSKPSVPIDVLMHETGMKEVKVPGLVHRLLDRKEWAGQPGAYEAIKKEKDGLVGVGTWIESEIVSKKDVLSWATSCLDTSRSTNGYVLALEGPASFALLSWCQGGEIREAQARGEEANIEVVSDEEEVEVASSSSARAFTPKASGAVPEDVEEESIPEPKTPPRDSTFVVTVPKKKAKPALPKEPSYPPPAVPKEPSYPPPAADRELDFVGLRALACDHQGQVIKVKASQLQGCKGIISWDFHRVLDRDYNDYKDCTDWRAPGLPWRNQQLLKRLHEQIRQGQILSIVLSYCHAEDTRLHVLNSVATACEEVFGQTGFTPVDLIVLTDKATGRIGKLAAIKLLSKGEIPVLHLDDSVEVVSELAGHRNITPIHIAVPRRGRTEYPSAPVPSFSSPCDAEETVLNFIQRCID
ncbi:hypothetical protein AK812_SmicGene24425 [Symbiodinium microadriaticum]|uniref:Integrase catalytic domain-containing protein n=1 Tax=Symbiodinium microadriaticum TaxID=2951 RepID=A0A1Q9DES3_SYMMI|nr:hypothetical protein AK812_SmicGene24425 [Symbiodinium microadriaticum]